jgi:hypothetical protein
MSERGGQVRKPFEQPALVVGGHPTVQHHEPANSRPVLGFRALELDAAVAAGTARHGRFRFS